MLRFLIIRSFRLVDGLGYPLWHLWVLARFDFLVASHGDTGVFEVVLVVELRLESRCSLASQELVQEASWTPIARGTAHAKLINRVILCTTGDLCVDLLCEVFPLLSESLHIFSLFLSSIHIGEAPWIFVFATTAAINRLIAVLMPVVVHEWNVVGEICDTHISFLNRW